jgi:hypothetical protein
MEDSKWKSKRSHCWLLEAHAIEKMKKMKKPKSTTSIGKNIQNLKTCPWALGRSGAK